MTTKHRFRNGQYRIELREKDHLPPHVHLTGGGLDVMIDIATATVMVGVCPASLRREVLAWIKANNDELMKDWKKWHR